MEPDNTPIEYSESDDLLWDIMYEPDCFECCPTPWDFVEVTQK